MIRKCLNTIKICVKKMFYLYNGVLLKYSEKKIKKIRNCHVGKRCFIVGNGPSLHVEDLRKLKDEICFGTHRIYTLFDKTDWRPTYYCAQDSKLINSSVKNISDMHVKQKLIALQREMLYKPFKGVDYLELKTEQFYPDLPKFSQDISKGVYEGFTVTYMCLQVAVYMGFSEIYLLGMDHSYSVELQPDGNVKTNLGVQDHFSKLDQIENIPQTYKSTLAYEAAKQYAERHGIKIYNASRGGRLEVFERIDFDAIKI